MKFYNIKNIITAGIIIFFTACSSRFYLPVTSPNTQRMGGNAFFKLVADKGWKQRDSLALKEITGGNIPDFFKKFVPVYSHIKDSAGKTHNAVFYVSPDYIVVGTNDDFARLPLTSMAGQKIADHFNCFLPTKKMVDLIYEQAAVKLEPVPMFAFRDSSVTMWQHHLIIEGQRKGRKGLIAGIKKDVVISLKMMSLSKSDRVAIYGWHQLNGQPIQPLYTGHVNWWVDYSHGIRLVYRKITVNGRQMDFKDVLKDPVYHKLLSDEGIINFFKYND